MNFSEFWRRFGGSSRSKHLQDGGSIIPSAQGGSDGQNKRRFILPADSELPADFIRMEPWEIEYLFMLASMATRGAVEIGRLNGGSVFVMACANDQVPVFSIDVHPTNDELLRSYFEKCSVGRNVTLIVGDSQQTNYPEIGAFDLCYIDGDHSYEGCTRDLEKWFAALSRGGHLLLHDAYLGSPVQKSVIDFIGGHDVDVVVSPYRGHTHWLTDHGSLAHLVKR